MTNNQIAPRTLDTMIREFRQVYPDRTYAEVKAMFEQIARLDTRMR